MKLQFIFAAAACLFSIAAPARAEETQKAPPASENTPPPKTTGDPVKPAARREDVEPPTLTEARVSLKQARGERDQAEADLLAEQGAHAATNQKLTAANLEVAKIAGLTKERDDAKADADSAKKAQAGFVTLIKSALGLTDDQVTALATDDTIIPVAVENLAGRKAVVIAAAQGIPPVNKPKSETEEKKITRPDFEAKSHDERNRLIRDGWKVVE